MEYSGFGDELLFVRCFAALPVNCCELKTIAFTEIQVVNKLTY